MFNIFKNHNLDKLYLSGIFQKLSLSMISVFIPIYLINIGYDLLQVALFFLLYSFFHMIIAIPSGKFGAKFGFRYLILISIPFQILFFALLFSLENNNLPLYLLAFVKGIGSTSYWTGMHSLMAKFTDKGKRGSEIGLNKIIRQISSIPGPLIGGYLLNLLNIYFLLFTISILLLLSTIPLFFIKEKKQKINLKLNETLKDLNLNEKVILINTGIDDAMESFIWNVYAFFFILNEYVILGTVKFVQKTFSLISHYISGKLFDKKGANIIKFGGIASLFIWIGRFFVYSPFFVYIVDSFRGLFHPLISTGFDAECYEIANSKNKLISFIVIREMLIHLGKIILFGVFLIIKDLRLMLIAGIIYSLVYMKFKFDENIIPPKICNNLEN